MKVHILHDYIDLPRQAIDLKDQRFGRLLVIGPIGFRGSYVVWHALCDCGKDVQVRSGHLRDGSTKSCGCLRKENNHGTTHGQHKSRVYSIWAGIKDRCNNPNAKSYHNYGGRGIKMCQEWNESFEAFRGHVNALPGHDNPKLSLDRTNNDGDYTPGNVRWATMAQQRRNSRQNHMITYQGKTQCLMDWSIELNMSYALLQQRLNYGWSMEEAATTPMRDTRLITANGVAQCAGAWERATGIPGGTIRKRLQLGWSPEQAVTTPVRKFTRRTTNADC